jgi:hypothetical protein
MGASAGRHRTRKERLFANADVLATGVGGGDHPHGRGRPWDGLEEGGSQMADTAYCMKCRQKREFEGHLVTLKNGRPAMQGTCPVCGTKLTKIMGMDAAKAMGWSAP